MRYGATTVSLEAYAPRKRGGSTAEINIPYTWRTSRPLLVSSFPVFLAAVQSPGLLVAQRLAKGAYKKTRSSFWNHGVRGAAAFICPRVLSVEAKCGRWSGTSCPGPTLRHRSSKDCVAPAKQCDWYNVLPVTKEAGPVRS